MSNAQDTFYRARAADMALTNGHSEIAIYLVQNGSDVTALSWEASRETTRRSSRLHWPGKCHVRAFNQQ